MKVSRQFTPLIRLAAAFSVVAAGAIVSVGPAAAAKPVAPSAPTGVTAVPGDRAAVVSWNDVTPPPGQSITGYTVTASKGKGCKTATTLSCTVTRLRNGVSYTVRVRDFTDVKKSGYSTPVTVTPGLPTTPSDVSATAGTGQATVSFGAPADNGSAITGYGVTAIDLTSSAAGGETAGGGSSPITVTGLTNGDRYSFTVTATNRFGTGAASAASQAVTPDTVPGIPTDVVATAQNARATVDFTGPSGAVTGFLVTATDGTTASGGGQTANGSVGPIVVSGLTNGDSYTFAVTAVNGSVEGSPSDASAPVVPSSPPILEGTGSSFASVAIDQWVGQVAELYGLDINWQVSSSVTGLNDFAQGQIDFAGSDLPYSSGQASSTPNQPYQYLPDVASGLAFMFNLVGTNGQSITDLNLNAHVIDEIFLGEITTWNSPSISALNPQLAGDLPSTTIVPVYRTDASGENYLLSDYMLHLDATNFSTATDAFQGVSASQPSANWPIPSPTSGFSHATYPGWAADNLVGANGSDEAANYVSALSSDGSITYVETAYADQHSLPVASLVNANGDDVQPTSANVATALGAATVNPDLTQDLADVYTDPQPTAYPLSAYSYLVVPCSPSLASDQGATCDGTGTTSPFSSAKGQVLGQFIAYLACAGQEKMSLLGYSPLPADLVQDDFNAIGRMNGGVQPPVPTAANCANPNIG